MQAEQPVPELVNGNYRLAFQLLGGFRVSVQGQPVPDSAWRLRKVKNLIKLLALAPGRRLHRDQILDLLWPDSDLRAGSNLLYQALHAARRLLAEPTAASSCLSLENGFLSLAAEAWVDVDQFESAAQALKTGHCQDPAEYLRALALYSGDLLPEDLYEEWTLQRRESLRLSYLNLLQELSRIEEERGNYSGAVAALQRLLSADRSSEAAHVGLMRLYALSGERQQALRQYQTLREVLLAELEVEPGPTAEQLHQAIRDGSYPPIDPAGMFPMQAQHLDQTTGLIDPRNNREPKHNLPAELTSFIGRSEEIDTLNRMVIEHRLVTLTGSGGIGKTRLALKIASSMIPSGAAGVTAANQFADGVYLVELAALSDPDLVGQATFQALGLPEQPGIVFSDVLVRFLAQKHLLLILDNCEHLLNACVQMADRLLKACPNLHILATSREILSVPGEIPYRVPSMATPYTLTNLRSPLALADIAQVEAVQLFVERAAQVSPGMEITETNGPLIAQIVRRLDGIPLAIELAAARVRMLTIEQIAARLDNTFHLLTGGSRTVLPRQQTLKATLDWSYELLSPKEQLLFTRLSVFAGGWLLDAAEVVCVDDADESLCDCERLDALEVMDLLAQLVDKSLVTAEAGERETRYHMLEVMRQYALGRLVESGCGAAVRDRHLEYFTRLTGEAEIHLRGKRQGSWLARLGDEMDNLRSALEWSRSRNITRGLQMIGDLMWFWHNRGMFIEAIDWAELLLAAEAQERADAPISSQRALQRARALRTYNYADFYIQRSQPAGRSANLQECVRLLRGLPESAQPGTTARRELGVALFYCVAEDQRWDGFSPEREEMLEIFNQEQERFYLSEVYYYSAGVATSRGNLQQAQSDIEQSLAICTEIEDIDGMSSRTLSLGDFAIWGGDYQRARALYNQAAALCGQANNRWFPTILNNGRVWLEMAQGHYAEASRLGEEALSIFREYYLVTEGTSLRWLQGDRIQLAWGQGDEVSLEELANEVYRDFPQTSFTWQMAKIYQGLAALNHHRIAEAETLLKHAADHCSDNDFRRTLPLLLAWTTLYLKQGLAERAARLLGAIDEIYARTAPGLPPRVRSDHDADLAAAQASLGVTTFEHAWEAGKAMMLDEAVSFVRKGSDIV